MESMDASVIDWPGKRPYIGGSLLIVGGILTAYVPIQFTGELLMIGGVYTLFGLVFAVLITSSGVVALLYPELAPLAGLTGVVLTYFSLVSALGGLVIAAAAAFLGSVICIVWWVLRTFGD